MKIKSVDEGGAPMPEAKPEASARLFRLAEGDIQAITEALERDISDSESEELWRRFMAATN